MQSDQKRETKKKKNEKKCSEPQRDVGYHQMHQNMYNRSGHPEERKRQKKKIKTVRAEKTSQI